MRRDTDTLKTDVMIEDEGLPCCFFFLGPHEREKNTNR